MFFSFFLSKNQKLVQHWKDDHKLIVTLATDIISHYDDGDILAVKKQLSKLHDVAVKHLMEEDLEMFDLVEESTGVDENTVQLIKEFRETFRGTKTTVMNFLSHYTLNETEIDEKFIQDFDVLVGTLATRIAFEEENLYVELGK